MNRLGLVARRDTTRGNNGRLAADGQQQIKGPRLAISAVLVAAVALAAGGFLYYKTLVQQKRNAEIEARLAAASTEASRYKTEAQHAKDDVEADRARPQAEAPKGAAATSSIAKPAVGSSGDDVTKGPRIPRTLRGGPTHYFDPSDFQLSISNAEHYMTKPFVVENLDLGRNFMISFQVKSMRTGGSTRYGIAWNYTPNDFLLFTIHSTSAGYYSIGPGRSQQYAPFVRLSQGDVELNAERDFDILQMTKDGRDLVFAINGKEVWRTRDYRVTSNRFAFWVADFSDALIRSYSLQQ
jgi:hypothetical protein